MDRPCPARGLTSGPGGWLAGVSLGRMRGRGRRRRYCSRSRSVRGDRRNFRGGGGLDRVDVAQHGHYRGEHQQSAGSEFHRNQPGRRRHDRPGRDGPALQRRQAGAQRERRTELLAELYQPRQRRGSARRTRAPSHRLRLGHTLQSRRRQLHLYFRYRYQSRHLPGAVHRRGRESARYQLSAELHPSRDHTAGEQRLSEVGRGIRFRSWRGRGFKARRCRDRHLQPVPRPAHRARHARGHETLRDLPQPRVLGCRRA